MNIDLNALVDQLYPFASNTLDPYPFYTTLREHAPVFWQTTGQGAWHLTRYEDVAVALRDPRFSAHRSLGQVMVTSDQMTVEERERVDFFIKYIGPFMLLQDPPDHTRLRTLVLKAFTPRVIEGLRVRIQEIVDQLLAPSLYTGEMDVVETVAAPLPLTVVMELLGIPIADREQFKTWSDELFKGRESEGMQRAFIALFSIVQYLREIVVARQTHPEEDLISALVTARYEGAALTEAEIISQCHGILVAGYETTTASIANGMLALLNHPHSWLQLRDNSELVEPAFEELLRYDCPFQFAERTAKSDIYLADQHIRAGDNVVLWLGAANRDPARFPEPDRLDFTRQDNRHLAFGVGVHYCLGAALARLEGQIAFKSLIRSLQDIRLVDTSFERQTGNPALRTVHSLRIAFTPLD